MAIFNQNKVILRLDKVLEIYDLGACWSDGMNSLAIETQEPRAQTITINEDSLSVDLMDGRTIIAPLIWYPRLWYGTAEERDNFEIIGDGALIHWHDLDEDLSVGGILAGRRSGESQKSLKKWIEERGARNL